MGRVFAIAYGLLVSGLGAALTVSHALLNEEVYQTTVFYLEVLLLYLYGLSMAFLFYMHCHRWRKRAAPRYVNATPRRTTFEISAPKLQHATMEIDRSVAPLKNLTPVPSLRDDRVESPDSPRCIESAPVDANGVDLSADPAQRLSSGDDTRGLVTADAMDPCPPQVVKRHVSAPYVRFRGQGVGFYLRLGAVVFALASMVFDGLQIAEYIELRNTLFCESYLFVAVCACRIVFTLFQTYFVFKNHTAIFVRQKGFVRFALMHLFVTNLCSVFFAVIKCAEEDYRHFSSDRFGTHSPMGMASVSLGGGATGNASARPTALGPVAPRHLAPENGTLLICYSKRYLSDEAFPYLLPQVVVYSALAAATVLKVFTQVGIRTRRGADSESHTLSLGAADSLHAECHKANRGLFCGLLITALSFVAVSVFFVLNTKLASREMATYIIFGTELGLLLLLFLATLFALCRLRRLARVHLGCPLNTILLLIGLAGLCTFYSFVGLAAVRLRAEQTFIVWLLVLVNAAFNCVQATVQSCLLLGGFQRQVGDERDAEEKPGRSLLTFVLVLNLVVWGVNTFEIASSLVFAMPLSFYGHLAWSLIWYSAFPLVILFRFHSAVCLAQIWTAAYDDRDIYSAVPVASTS